MTGLRARTAIWAVLALVPVLVVAALAAEPFVYVRGGVAVAYAEITPRVLRTGLPEPHERVGGLITADLDGDGRWDFAITGPDRIGAVAASGAHLWSTEVDIQVTGQAESEGLPGLHAPGVQAADIDGDGATEVLFLTRGGSTSSTAPRASTEQRCILPAPPAEAERWEHGSSPPTPWTNCYGGGATLGAGRLPRQRPQRRAHCRPRRRRASRGAWR